MMDYMSTRRAIRAYVQVFETVRSNRGETVVASDTPQIRLESVPGWRSAQDQICRNVTLTRSPTDRTDRGTVCR